MPDTAPEGVDPWVEMAAAARGGSDSGVRLSHAVEVVIADGSGNPEQVRDAIRRHAASLKVDKPNRDYQLLDLEQQLKNLKSWYICFWLLLLV